MNIVVFFVIITDGRQLSTMSNDKIQKSKNEINGQQMWPFIVGSWLMRNRFLI